MYSMYTVCIYIYICIVNKLRAVVACLLSRAIPYPPQSKTETKNSAELQLSPYTEKMCKNHFWHYLYCRTRIGNNYTNGCGNTIPESGNFFGRVFNFHMTISIWENLKRCRHVGTHHCRTQVITVHLFVAFGAFPIPCVPMAMLYFAKATAPDFLTEQPDKNEAFFLQWVTYTTYFGGH